ncbi:MAG: hypothetical protein JWO48_2021 [Bryobacterales bacterium]|nr:hypothetical protein [Bryobacterales bacterium]
MNRTQLKLLAVILVALRVLAVERDSAESGASPAPGKWKTLKSMVGGERIGQSSAMWALLSILCYFLSVIPLPFVGWARSVPALAYVALGACLFFTALGFALDPKRSERKRRLGLCDHCGYDLRATPARCP